MKYEITPEDRQVMEYDLKTDRVLKHLKNLSFYKFSIGDVLIREEKYRNYGNADTLFEWKTKLADCGLPNKYVYVFENELGIGYIRRLSVNGRKYVDKPICVTEFDPDQTRFALDPEYADHMLLSSEDDEFDVKSRYDEIKKKREQIHRKNKKIRLDLQNETQAVEWMKTLKVGDQFWWGHSISNIYKEPYFIHEINLQTGIQSTAFGSYYSNNRPHIRVSTTAPNTNTASGFSSHGSVIYATSIPSYLFFNQRPSFVEEIIN